MQHGGMIDCGAQEELLRLAPVDASPRSTKSCPEECPEYGHSSHCFVCPLRRADESKERMPECVHSLYKKIMEEKNHGFYFKQRT